MEASLDLFLGVIRPKISKERLDIVSRLAQQKLKDQQNSSRKSVRSYEVGTNEGIFSRIFTRTSEHLL